MALSKSWVARGVIAVVLAIVGYDSVSRGAAATLANRDAVLALSVSASDARVMGSAAQAILEQAKNDTDRRRAEQLARQAFLQDGTSLPAITTLAFVAGTGGDDKAANGWFAYAERLSRRDLRTQLYLIESAVAKGEIATALHHYDIALRASDESAPNVLFPVLRGAISDQAIRDNLAKTLAARPLWSNAFVQDLVAKGPDFVSAAALLADARRRGAVIPQDLEDSLLGTLVGRGQIVPAWEYFVASHPSIEKQLVRNTTFAADGAGNTPFDWLLSTDNGVSSSLGANDNAKSLEYKLAPAVSGQAVRQILRLSPGRYRLQTVTSAASQRLGAGPYWDLKCIGGQPIATLEIGGPLNQPRTFATDLTVPAACEGQILALIVRPSDDVQGATGQIDMVSLTKVQ